MRNFTLMFFALMGFLVTSCVKEGPMGPQGVPGRDGNANVYYSPWYNAQQWAGSTGDWYFDVSNTALTQDVVEGGAILAYMSVPNDIYTDAVRPMPSYVDGANWDFLLPEYGMIEFTSDRLNVPSTNCLFRFVIIPSNISLKSGSTGITTLNDIKAMNYQEMCKKLGIPEK